jgi:hypothetical protein
MSTARGIVALSIALAPLAITLGPLGACGGSRATTDAGVDGQRVDGGSDGPRVTAFHPDASCLVTIDTPSFGAAIHVDEDAAITYTSNPPAGGPHYPRWAAFAAYTTPIPRPYYVHDMEHGAVVLLYKCDDDAGAPDASVLDGSIDASADGGTCESRAQDFLANVVAALPTDPTCTPNIRVRTVITPDPLIPTPFAAAAWGWTYTAACADLPSLVDFAKAHYAKAPEDECANGSYPP